MARRAAKNSNLVFFLNIRPANGVGAQMSKVHSYQILSDKTAVFNEPSLLPMTTSRLLYVAKPVIARSTIE